MNHDIQHCDGENCKIKDKCLRYTEYKKLMKLRELVWMFMTPPNQFGNCDKFIKNY